MNTKQRPNPTTSMASELNTPGICENNWGQGATENFSLRKQGHPRMLIFISMAGIKDTLMRQRENHCDGSRFV